MGGRFISGLKPSAPLLAVSAGPVLLVLIVLFGPFLTSPLVTHSGLGLGVDGQILRGGPSVDPNIAITSFALGTRAALDVVSGYLPLWNHFQGFGAPLLGGMQSAALFPPTLLLLLPSGQALEHIFLQWLAGVGAFLFFRRFGLGTAASVAGAILFELNGVFATLRNAAFNPVAFLPWLMFGVEAMRGNALGARSFFERLPATALTAVMGALALYAGFPETAYLYGLFVVAWGLFRIGGLQRRQAAALFLDLAAAASFALVLSAPLLVAFLAYLAEGDVGDHGEVFGAMWQEKEVAILYLLPYLYGMFTAAPDARLAGLSISSGGYVALAPVVLATASLCVPGHRAAKGLLCAWLAIALGATHGWPVIHTAFRALPLMDLAVPGRYLNASWIFCIVFLAALAIDQLPRLDASERRRAVLGAAIGTAVIIVAAALPAAEMMPRAWQTVPSLFIASLVAASLAIAGSLIALGAPSPRLRATALVACLLEAVALFVVPFLAYPRSGDVDREALVFLRGNVGYQRVAKSDGTGIAANFGSALGVGLLHFDDLPSPNRSIAYLRTRVDPYASHIFLPENPPLPEKELAERKREFKERLPAYAAAGVKYVMAAPDWYAEPALSFDHSDARPVVLEEGQTLAIEGRRADGEAITVDALTIRVGTFRNTATGSFAAWLCANGACANGETDLVTANDGKPLLFRLDAPLTIEGGTVFVLEFQKRGGTAGVIWTYPRANGSPAMRVIGAPGSTEAGHNIELGFIPLSRPKPVHTSRSMAFYELEDVRPYAAAAGCEVVLRSHDRMETVCTRASRLTRLTVHMNGWRARVNGAEVPISLAEETFQVIDLPQGSAQVAFRYAPPGFDIALTAACAALLLLLACFVRAGMPRRQNSADAAAALP